MTGITLCIVNHNGADHLRQTLPNLPLLRGIVDEALLLDNASSDASREVFSALVPWGRIMQLHENRSPGAARNAGFKAARNDLILFADNDILLTRDVVTALAAALQADPDCVIALPRVILTRRPARIQYEGAYCHWLGHMILRNEDALLEESGATAAAVAVDSMVSACFLLARKRWPAPPLFDPGYRFYYEDHDVGARARLAGRRILAVSRAVVLHGEGTPNLSMRPGGRYAPRRIQTLLEGRWRHLAKNLSRRGWWVLGPGLLAYEILQLGAVIAKGWLPHWWIAFRYTCGSFRELREQRRGIQASRCIADRELLRGGPLPFKPELTTGGLARLALRSCNAMFQGYWALARRLL